jgi:hypothetical protein
MKKENIILLSAGIILAVIIFSGIKSRNVIKPGDKGNDVAGLQGALSSIAGVSFSNTGAYDNSTLSAVQSLLKGSSALVDYDKGYVDRKFAADLYIIQNNSKQA